jgi:hypothetical protein
MLSSVNKFSSFEKEKLKTLGKSLYSQRFTGYHRVGMSITSIYQSGTDHDPEDHRIGKKKQMFTATLRKAGGLHKFSPLPIMIKESHMEEKSKSRRTQKTQARIASIP